MRSEMLLYSNQLSIHMVAFSKARNRTRRAVGRSPPYNELSPTRDQDLHFLRPEHVLSDRDLDGPSLTNRVLAETRKEAPHHEVEHLPLVNGEGPPRGLSRRINRRMGGITPF